MRAYLKPFVFTLGLLPLGWLLWGVANNSLGPDPAEHLMHVTGEWSLRFLVLTLLMSPLRERWQPALRLRRMLGLFVFFYATLHLLVFLQVMVGWTPTVLWEELVERPYITLGFVAWLLLMPLAVTSTRNMQRRLGRKWTDLHRLVYAVAILACLHLLWQARSDLGEALVYCLVFAVLLAWRVRRRHARVRSAS